MIRKSTIQFLKQLAKNNNKPWFDENKAQFLDAKQNVEQFMLALKDELNQHDKIEAFKLYRIYRDVRFSKDKTPYKTYFSGYLSREGADRRGGYWVSIEADKSIIGGGFYGPEKHDLLRIRQEFSADGEQIKKIVSAPQFVKYFAELKGEGVKTAPKGFSKDDQNIDLIRKKQFYAFRSFSDAEVTSPEFVKEAVSTFQALRPFFDYMSEVLTTDANGRKLI